MLKMIGITPRESVEFIARCRAFTGEGVKENRILVDPNGEVRVWDAVAGTYTLCHALSDRQQARLRALARRLR